MSDMMMKVVTFLVLAGFFLAVVLYRPLCLKCIRTKGYDPDTGLGKILGVASIALPAVLGINVVRNGLVLILLFLVPFALNIAMRVSKIGFGMALIITVLQTLGVVWMGLKALIEFAWNAMGVMNGTATVSSKPHTRQEKVDVKKAAAYQMYQANMTMGDISPEEAEEEYDAAVTKADQEPWYP